METGGLIPTAVTTRRPPAKLSASLVNLREDFVRSAKPLVVDRDKGIIYATKICGWHSDNNREYLPEAAKRALAMYEGRKSYCDHPVNPTDSRTVRDALGVHRNVRVEPDGVYSDFHYFKAH